MDELSDLVQRYTAGLIDFRGQELSEKIISKIVYSGVGLACVVGYVTQDFMIMVYGLGVVAVLILIFSLPLPIYKKNPPTWLEYTPITSSKVIIDHGDEKTTSASAKKTATKTD